MIRAVIFDMDGVLIDAKEWHYEALNRALAEFGHTIPRHEHETIYDGLPTKKKLEMLHARNGLPLELAGRINERKQHFTMEMARERCRPMRQHTSALHTLQRLGYKLAVASNSIRQSVALMMEQAGLAPYLELQLSNEDVTHAKPHPEIYERAIRHFKLEPNECLIVEDNENGVKAARASGAHVYVVRDVYDVSLENILARVDNVSTYRRAA